MQVIGWNRFLKNGFPGKIPVSMTVGVFDGVHRGHRALIERVVSRGAASAAVPVVVTFREPAHKGENRLQTFEEKSSALEALGVKTIIVADFTDSFSRMTGKEFLEILLSHVDIGFFAIGANFRCGCGLDTDAEKIKGFLAARGIPVEIVKEVLHDGEPISSSRIRAALFNGELELAEALIG